MADTKRDAIGSILNPNQLADYLRYVAPALSSALDAMLPVSARPWVASDLPVAANTSGALSLAGEVTAVEATAGAAPGVKAIVTAAPAAGEAQVVYDANGVPTINFNAADAITAIRIKANALPADYLARMAEERWT